MTTSPTPTTAAPPTALPQPRWVRPVFIANLAAQVGIIVTGGLVRLTGSGLGCPTWPECVPGSYVPTVHQEEGYHKFIEFGNRTLTFVLLLLAAAVLYAIYRRLPGRRDLRRPALLLIGGIAAQAIIGGITVRTGLSPLTVSVHFLVSAWLVQVAAELLFTLDTPAASPQDNRVPALVRRVAYGTAGVGALVLALGTVVTGSGPHSGDAARPARYGFDPRTMSWLHADAVMLFAGLAVAVWLAVRLLRLGGQAARAWDAVLVITVIQGVLGYTQYLAGLPGAMVITHMGLAGGLVIALTWGVLALRRA